MQTIKVGNIVLGQGCPKICVPITETSFKDIREKAKLIKESKADLAEWRADWFEGVSDLASIVEVLYMLKEELGDKPLLFTFRTEREGGEGRISTEEYTNLNLEVIRTGMLDLIDLEVFSGITKEEIEEFIKVAHENGVIVVGSNHNFQETPEKQEMIRRLCEMQDLGVDIPKLAVMPRNKKDVLALLAATEEMSSEHARGPIITMSMSGMGLVSRICGELLGSALTFGAMGAVSAPGQIEVEELSQMITIMHRSME